MTFTMYAGDLSPSIADTLSIGGDPFPTDSCSVRFQARRLGDSTLAIDSAATFVGTAGDMRYDWKAGETDVVGTLTAWWLVTLANGKTMTKDAGLVVFQARGSRGPELCSLADIREAERLSPGEGQSRDALRETLISAASPVIERWCQREFSDRGTLTRTFPYDGNSRIKLTPYDLRSVDAITFDGVAYVADTDYSLDLYSSDNGTCQMIEVYRSGFGYGVGYGWGHHRESFPRRHARPLVAITGKWGMLDVPADVRQAAVITVRSWMDAGTPSDTPDSSGDPRALGAAPGRGYWIPYAARMLLRDFRPLKAA